MVKQLAILRRCLLLATLLGCAVNPIASGQPGCNAGATCTDGWTCQAERCWAPGDGPPCTDGGGCDPGFACGGEGTCLQRAPDAGP
ncbi:MAG: hypothetical protein ACYDCL_04225 [Myxococcales bacterium]